MVCSDKTGTLTENRMEVTCLYTATHRHVDIDKGGAVCDGCKVTPTTHPDVIKVIEVNTHHERSMESPLYRMSHENVLYHKI